MREKKKNDSKPTKTDLLIEEAVRAVESHETAEETSTEVQSKDSQPSKDSGAIARIDLQQFVEKEAYLRLAADFENYRKRSVKERQDAEKSGKEKVLRGFLEILDNLDRGLTQSADQTGPLADGIRMVLSQVDSWLKAEGVLRIETLGLIFDPAVHEAVSQEDSEKPVGTILYEVRRGYRWSDRLLRPAAVIVSKGREENS